MDFRLHKSSASPHMMWCICSSVIKKPSLAFHPRKQTPLPSPPLLFLCTVVLRNCALSQTVIYTLHHPLQRCFPSLNPLRRSSFSTKLCQRLHSHHCPTRRRDRMFSFHNCQQPYHAQPESLIVDDSAGGWHYLFGVSRFRVRGKRGARIFWQLHKVTHECRNRLDKNSTKQANDSFF